MRLDLVHKLIRHYKNLSPDAMDRFTWSYTQCAAGVLYEWGEIPALSRNNLAGKLQISQDDGYRLVYAANGTSDALSPVPYKDSRHFHKRVLAMLEFLAEKGYVHWPEVEPESNEG